VSGELKTPAVVLVVVVLNAVLGFVQENRAEKSLDALRRLVVRTARVRRNGEQQEVAAEELVPGDIVLVEAGDKVPADGRLVMASNLEIDEAILTGESAPVAKNIDVVDDADVLGDALGDTSIGDRTCMAHMNATVTRGRGEFVVTSTGMSTEIGRIAGLISSTNHERTPLQRQLDTLAGSLAKLAGVIVAAVFVIGLARGESIGDLLLTAVALAVAAIPEGLPAVTAVTLAIGVSKMAKQHAIVKRLASVETLGCTSVICSDKTGTLTLNQMTAVDLVVQFRSHQVTGTGYGPIGEIEHHPADDPDAMANALRAVALCNDSTIRPERSEANDAGWQLVGDPTEGALTVLAGKGGVDVAALRSRFPRRAEVPFDSASKIMATVHDLHDGADTLVVYVKGAPDVLVARGAEVIGRDGDSTALGEVEQAELSRLVDAMASQGLRVLGVAERRFATQEFERLVESGIDLSDLLVDLTLVALVGIVDPPRAEARDAIAEAHAAGMSVKMITGDHAATARSIAGQLGIRGSVITGNDLDAMSDNELDDRVRHIGVFARVSPDHKLRVVSALKTGGDVVAMTGDGVNDAPALKKADIGVAMGITGTEVTKEAATMILTDDNFATIVGAVRRGRTIYDNIVKFVRFQLSTTIGFAALFLLAGILGIASGKPFTAIAILWVNLVMDGPPAMALGVDRAGPDVMQRRPRPVDEPILTRRRWWAVGLSATVMALGTLGVLAWAPGVEPISGTATVAGTMAFNTFVLFQFFNLLNVRSESTSVFHRSTFTNRWLWASLSAVLALQFAVTHVGWFQQLFDTTSISAVDWLVCAAVASCVLWVEEIRKVVTRRSSAVA
jgi:P-type Ca2+ transporter type 2C